MCWKQRFRCRQRVHAIIVLQHLAEFLKAPSHLMRYDTVIKDSFCIVSRESGLRRQCRLVVEIRSSNLFSPDNGWRRARGHERCRRWWSLLPLGDICSRRTSRFNNMAQFIEFSRHVIDLGLAVDRSMLFGTWVGHEPGILIRRDQDSLSFLPHFVSCWIRALNTLENALRTRVFAVAFHLRWSTLQPILSDFRLGPCRPGREERTLRLRHC